MVPEDVVAWVRGHFRPKQADDALYLISKAVDHTGAPVDARLARCVAVGSRGDMDRLRDLVKLCAIDYRDVIMCGEYDMIDKKLVHVRNLIEPIPPEHTGRSVRPS